jgi:hypothetical protein
MDNEQPPRQSDNPLRRERPTSDSNSGETRTKPLQVTIDRWRKLASEISAWADEVDSDSQQEAQARARIGELCCRECLSQRYAQPVDGSP